MTFQKKSAQIVIPLLSKIAALTENLVAWQTFFCSILQQTRELLTAPEFFLDIFNRQKFYFQLFKKESTFNTSIKYSLRFICFRAGVYAENSISQAQNITGKIYQIFFFFISF